MDCQTCKGKMLASLPGQLSPDEVSQARMAEPGADCQECYVDYWQDKMNEESTYQIVRKYADPNHPDHNKVIDEGRTLAEAQEHCKDPTTHEKGVWFDCFYKE